MKTKSKMITLLRKIRKRLVRENKISTYLLYALGEILLVVIGILIALWLNNLNESRKNNKAEKEILIALQSEIEENQLNLSHQIKSHERVVNLVRELNNWIAPSPAPISDERMDSLMFGLGHLPAYNPKDRTWNSFISSGKIALIKNKKLNELLSSATEPLKSYREIVKWNEKQYFEIIMPYIKEKYPFKRIVSMFGVRNSNGSKFKYSKEKLLSDVGFESLVSCTFNNEENRGSARGLAASTNYLKKTTK